METIFQGLRTVQIIMLLKDPSVFLNMKLFQAQRCGLEFRVQVIIMETFVLSIIASRSVIQPFS